MGLSILTKNVELIAIFAQSVKTAKSKLVSDKVSIINFQY